MKTKNTLVELLRHQLKLAEAGASFENQFEFLSRYNGEWVKCSADCLDFMDGDDWRIVDQDQQNGNNMKTKNTLVELLQHQLKLAEAGKKFDGGQFEFFVKRSGKWHPHPGCFPDFMNGDDWRIVDQDQHLLDRGWTRHTGDTCPVHRYDEGEVILKGVKGAEKRKYLGRFDWSKHANEPITHYRVTRTYAEGGVKLDLAKEFDRLTVNYDKMLKTLKLIASCDFHYTGDVVDIARKTVTEITGVKL